MLSGQEKLELLDKAKGYVCYVAIAATIAAIAIGAAGVFHKDFVTSLFRGVFMAVPITAIAGVVTWVIGKIEDRVLDRIWGD